MDKNLEQLKNVCKNFGSIEDPLKHLKNGQALAKMAFKGPVWTVLLHLVQCSPEGKSARQISKELKRISKSSVYLAIKKLMGAKLLIFDDMRVQYSVNEDDCGVQYMIKENWFFKN